MDDNRSLDLSDILARINKQAVLIGGPHDGTRAPLPPVIYHNEHPQYLCQPGRPHDATYYHYRLTTDTNYVYVDHCETLPGFSHHPDYIEQEQERDAQGSERLLFLCVAAIVCFFSALAMTGVGWFVYWFLK